MTTEYTPCRCGCGEMAQYAYVSGHRPEARGCSRCGVTFSPVADPTAEHCSQCRRHLRAGRPAEQDAQLISARKMQASAPEGRRWCSGCSKYRAERFFGSTLTDGVRKYYARCKPCKRKQGHATRIKKQYGITSEQYEEIKQYQGGTCAICLVATGKSKALAVDHDHSCCPAGGSCGRCVRGLLCSRCNQMIGHGRDNPEFFRRAALYIEVPPFRKMRDEWGFEVE